MLKFEKKPLTSKQRKALEIMATKLEPMVGRARDIQSAINSTLAQGDTYWLADLYDDLYIIDRCIADAMPEIEEVKNA